MRNQRKYLRPTIAIIASLVVGASGTILGANLAAPEPVELVASENETRTLPVIAPVAVGEEAPELDAADAATFTVSEAIAERDVPISTGDAEPGAGGGIHLDDLAESDDVGTLLGEPATDPSGDPCAPAEGEAAGEECPEGIRGTLFSLTTPPDLFVSGRAYPQSREDYLDDDRRNGLLWCETATGLAENEVPFGIMSPVPATFTLQYWPTDDPTDVRDGPAVATSAEASAAWEAEFAASETTPPLWLSHCLTLTGVEPGTHYTAKIVAVDLYDRIAVSGDIGFHGDGAPIRPSLVVGGFGNTMFTSAMHMATQSVTIRAWQFEPEVVPNCDGAGGTSLREHTSRASRVSDERLRELNVLGAYSHKLTQPYQVPEGATIFVCARWFEAGTAASWERTQPVFQSEVIAQTPDRILPVVTLEAVNPTGERTVSMAVSTAEGVYCNGGRNRILPARTLPESLCSATGLVHGGAGFDHSRRLVSDVGFRGDLVLTSWVEVSDDETVQSAVVLPLRDVMCLGVCELPATQWFTVALPTITEHRGLCGSSFGEECTPPSREVTAGTALVKVAWVQGNTNGRSSWNVLPPVDIAPEYVRPDVPQLDTEQYFEVTVDARTRYASASFSLDVDRPVNYTIRLSRWDSTSPACVHEGGSLIKTGRTDRATRISFSGLCVGSQYMATVELVDDDGQRAVWGLVDRSTWWTGAFFEVPFVDVNLSYRWSAQSLSSSAVARFELAVDHITYDARGGRGAPCTTDGIVSKSGSSAHQLGDRVSVRVYLEMQPARISGDECDSPHGSSYGVLSQATVVDLDDLLSPGGAVVTFEEPYAFTVTLWATPAG